MKLLGFKMKKLASKLYRSEKGVAAVEFALIFPLMFVLFTIAVEVSHYLKTDRQLTNTASLIGDRISQLPSSSLVNPSADIDSGDLLNFIQVIDTTIPSRDGMQMVIRIEVFERDVRADAAGSTTLNVHEFRKWLLRVKRDTSGGSTNQTALVNMRDIPVNGGTMLGKSDPNWARDGTTMLNPNFSNSELSEEMQSDRLMGAGSIKNYIKVNVEMMYKSPMGRLFNVETPISEEYIAVPRLVNFVNLTNNEGLGATNE